MKKYLFTLVVVVTAGLVLLNAFLFNGYMRNRHAEALGEKGRIRLRWTHVDNAPEGREVHWNSAFAWYLRGLGELRQMVTGESLRNSIFRMSVWANPILLALAICVFAPLVARRFGYMAGTALIIGMIGLQGFSEGFLPGYPDHHGIIALAILGLVIGILWAGALALCGGAWVAAAVADWASRRGQADNPFPWPRLLVPVCAAALLPLVVLLGGEKAYAPSSPYLLAA